MGEQGRDKSQSPGPNPVIHQDDLEAVLELAARLQREAERKKNAIVSDDVIDHIVAGTGISEEYIAEAQALLAKRKSARLVRTALGLGVLAGLAGLGAGAYFLAFEPTAGEEVAQAPPPPQATAPATTAAPAIQFAVVPNEFSAGLTIEPRYIRNSVYDDSAYLNLVLTVGNVSRREVHKLRCNVQLLDRNDRLLKTMAFQVLDTYMPELRPGDRTVTSHTQASAPGAAKLRLSVMEREDVPAPSLYGASTPIQPVWECEQPEHLNLVVRRRKINQSQAMYGRYYVRSVYEFHNQGEGAIRGLKAELRLFDQHGRQLKATDRIIITKADGMALLPGETALRAWIDEVPSRFHHATLHILDLD